jgi:hypothetical protein
LWFIDLKTVVSSSLGTSTGRASSLLVEAGKLELPIGIPKLELGNEEKERGEERGERI